MNYGIKVIFRRCRFRGYSKHFVFNVFLWEYVWFYVLFSIEVYKFLFLIFNIFIRWRNIGIESGIKVIFKRWIFRGKSKYFILNEFDENLLESSLIWSDKVCSYFSNFSSIISSWSAMFYFRNPMNSQSKLASRYFIVVVNSVCVT